MSNTNTYILSWDCFGLEGIVNATEMEQERIMNILADRNTGKNADVSQILSMMTLRARFNTQRSYEIYVIEVDENISKDDLVKSFKDYPQAMADLIRKQGREIYSDRVDRSKLKIV